MTTATPPTPLAHSRECLTRELVQARTNLGRTIEHGPGEVLATLTAPGREPVELRHADLLELEQGLAATWLLERLVRTLDPPVDRAEFRSVLAEAVALLEDGA